MATEQKPPAEKAPELEYFEFLAKVGMTKHFGSTKATDELVELCHVGADSCVLDVGCGVGATPAYLVKTVGCRVMGVDLIPGMIEQAQARARQEGIEDRVEFKVADARDLPFEDGTFDAVLVESVNVFFGDKLQAIRGYARVTKPGGYVGMTEMTWLETPSPKQAEYYRQAVYADSLEAHEWKDLMVDAGLKQVVANAYKLDLPAESRGRIQRYGCGGMIRIMLRVVSILFKDRSSRDFLKGAFSSVPGDVASGMGYGVYVGRKE